MDYGSFLKSKAQYGSKTGFAPLWIPDFLFDFQTFLVEWCIRTGRSAMLADCGMGKTPSQLVWSENVVRKTNKHVLILTPLAVAQQTVREAHKFGIDSARSAGNLPATAHTIVTNYEKLHHFNPSDFGGVVCDESSAIKAFDGKRRAEVTEFMRTIPYRLLCTATPAPNDYIELGTSSEALGVMGQVEMLNRFFKNDQNTSDMKGRDGSKGWRFKGHAELPFMKWVCGWARACRRASPRITIWKEPLKVRNRTMTKALAHKSIVEDSCDCVVAGADYLLVFRRKGDNKIPVTHEHGLMRYAGERKIPHDLMRYRGWTGNQIENRYSHWIWRQYASCVWDDIRGNTGSRATGVLPYREARDEEDEKHLHPLQLDVIERACVLWSNPGETVLTPFMGVGSEVCGALANGRRAVGCELKPSYYRQALKNIASVLANGWGESDDQDKLFAEAEESMD